MIPNLYNHHLSGRENQNIPSDHEKKQQKNLQELETITISDQ